MHVAIKLFHLLPTPDHLALCPSESLNIIRHGA